MLCATKQDANDNYCICVLFLGASIKDFRRLSICCLYPSGEANMWLPDRLYEALPFLYAIAGLYTAYYFDTALGYVSGFLLLVTAFLVWAMRRDYRQGKGYKKN